jgi:hypothetical protein
MLNSTNFEAITPDISEAQHFLKLLDENNFEFVFETIEEPKPIQGKPKVNRYTGTFEAHKEALIKANQEDCGVFVAVNATDGRGRKKENVNKIRAFFVDLDGSPLEPVLQGPLSPHIVIESSPRRYHAYWIVEDVPLEQFESIQKWLASRFNGDPSICDLPRVMRLPGFLHRKKESYQSRIIETLGTLPYVFDNFCAAFGWNRESSVEDETVHTPSSDIESLILNKLRERGLVKRLEDKKLGRWLIRCPWAEEHTNGEDAYFFAKPSNRYAGEGFNCFHAHCKIRDIRSLRFFLGLSLTEGVEPLPLFREMPLPLPFPVEALGPILGGAAMEIHKTIKAPLAVIAQSLLAAASLVAQGHANVEIDGRIIALSLFMITVAESGERKSAVDDVALSAVLDWQSCLWKTYRKERRIYEVKLEEWKNAKKKQNNVSGASISAEPMPEPPMMPIVIVEEPTYEGLVKYLEYGQPSVGLFSDEGGRFLGGNAMSRDNLLKTLAGLSSLWDAKPNKPITRVRSSDKSLALYGRRVALHLMIQESVYSTLNKLSLCESQGLLPRCLISFPDSLAGSRTYVAADPNNGPFVRKFKDHCNNLLDSKFPVEAPPAPQNQLTPPSISLTQGARSSWVEFHNDLEKKLGKGEIYHSIRRFGSKAAEHLLRIAGALAVFETPLIKEISSDYIQRGIEIVGYYLEERLRLDNYCQIDPILQVARKVLDWAQAKKKSGVYLRELYQFGPSEVRSKDKALGILKVLEEHGRAFPIPAHELTKGAKGKAWRFIWPVEG